MRDDQLALFLALGQTGERAVRDLKEIAPPVPLMRTGAAVPQAGRAQDSQVLRARSTRVAAPDRMTISGTVRAPGHLRTTASTASSTGFRCPHYALVPILDEMPPIKGSAKEETT